MKIKQLKISVEQLLAQSMKNKEVFRGGASPEPIPMIRRGDGSFVRGEALDMEEAEQYGISIVTLGRRE